jgi:hypothetical protein
MMGDTRLSVCLDPKVGCKYYAIGVPSNNFIGLETEGPIVYVLNPKVNFDEFVEIYESCSEQPRLIGKASMPGALTQGMCVTTEP